MLERGYQVPSKLSAFSDLHLQQGTKGAVRAYGKVSEEFNINTGVRQGDVLAPQPFLDAITVATLSQHAGSGTPSLLQPCLNMLGLVSRCSSIWWRLLGGKQEENEGGS